MLKKCFAFHPLSGYKVGVSAFRSFFSMELFITPISGRKYMAFPVVTSPPKKVELVWVSYSLTFNWIRGPPWILRFRPKLIHCCCFPGWERRQLAGFTMNPWRGMWGKFFLQESNKLHPTIKQIIFQTRKKRKWLSHSIHGGGIFPYMNGWFL